MPFYSISDWIFFSYANYAFPLCLLHNILQTHTANSASRDWQECLSKCQACPLHCRAQHRGTTLGRGAQLQTRVCVTSAAGTPITALALVSEGFISALCLLLQQLAKMSWYQVRSNVFSSRSFLACFPLPFVSILKKKRGGKNSFKAHESRGWSLENQLVTQLQL